MTKKELLDQIKDLNDDSEIAKIFIKQEDLDNYTNGIKAKAKISDDSITDQLNKTNEEINIYKNTIKELEEKNKYYSDGLNKILKSESDKIGLKNSLSLSSKDFDLDFSNLNKSILSYCEKNDINVKKEEPKEVVINNQSKTKRKTINGIVF